MNGHGLGSERNEPTMTSVRPIRRGARFQAGMLGIGACYAARCVTRQPINEVHEATAIKMERLVRDLRGAYVKSAQLISTAFPELLPAPWVSRLEVLVDDAPARLALRTRAELVARWDVARLRRDVDAAWPAVGVVPNAPTRGW